MIYFIQAQVFPFLIKIGFTESANVLKRFGSLKSSSAIELFLLLELPGTRHDEENFHKQFFAEKVKGEWFRPSNKILEFLLEKIEEKNRPFLRRADEKHNFSELNSLINEKSELNKFINKLTKKKKESEKSYLNKLNKLVSEINNLRKENKQLWREKFLKGDITLKECLVRTKEYSMNIDKFSNHCQLTLGRMYNV